MHNTVFERGNTPNEGFVNFLGITCIVEFRYRRIRYSENGFSPLFRTPDFELDLLDPTSETMPQMMKPLLSRLGQWAMRLGHAHVDTIEEA